MAAANQQILAALAASAGSSWTTIFQKSLIGDNNNWGGYNLAIVIDSSIYLPATPSTATMMRLTVMADSTIGCAWDGVRVGHPSVAGGADSYDFDGNQAQMKVSTSGSSSLAGGGSVLMDAAAFAFDKTKNLIVRMHFTGTSSLKFTTGQSGMTAFEHLAADETSTSDVSMSADSVGRVYFVSKIEVQ